ncbi:MAG: hypothetical protein V3V10_09865, partial [Planctomycetota bacterium]
AAHFDLLMEVEGEERLFTLQLENWPPPSKFVELKPHRRMYLDYEGEISDGRGSVKRVMSGEWKPNNSGQSPFSNGDCPLLLPDEGPEFRLVQQKNVIEYS